MKLEKLFTIKNGISSTLLSIKDTNDGTCVPYIRPSSTQNRTFSGWLAVESLRKEWIHPEETLFVSTDGEGSHTYAYVSDFQFVGSGHVAILSPKQFMTLQEKIFYARCITLNRYKFSYGRAPRGRRLANIELPDTVPPWVNSYARPTISSTVIAHLLARSSKNELNRPHSQENCLLKDIFDIIPGNKLDLNKMELVKNGIPFISRTSKNNGVSAYVKLLDSCVPCPGGVLTVALGGSVLSTYFQEHPFYTGQNVAILKPKKPMVLEEILFYAYAIHKNAYRFNACGREANRFLKDLLIPNRECIPNWVYGSLSRCY